ncbi:uncharacterized protein LOC114289680 [Camellia sinensis]|uniref:uncharacterized protein LOC114289680 n=1 Tax=Camellia sinensis TaxID=4442 RepID=UPI0010362B12|nr:uncharacterized protein LOC114289680 [Camellia sinensis]
MDLPSSLNPLAPVFTPTPTPTPNSPNQTHASPSQPRTDPEEPIPTTLLSPKLNPRCGYSLLLYHHRLTKPTGLVHDDRRSLPKGGRSSDLRDSKGSHPHLGVVRSGSNEHLDDPLPSLPCSSTISSSPNCGGNLPVNTLHPSLRFPSTGDSIEPDCDPTYPISPKSPKFPEQPSCGDSLSYPRIPTAGLSSSLHHPKGVHSPKPISQSGENPSRTRSPPPSRYRQILHVHSNSASWFFSAIYASPHFNLRRDLWDNLKLFADNHNFSWLIVGDFNEILSNADKFGGRAINPYRSQRFKSCIDHCGLMDLGFSGPCFTWTNLRQASGIIRERLDRALCNNDWHLLHPDTTIFHLPRIHSDHCPILLNLNPHLQSWSNPTNPYTNCVSDFKDRVSLWNKTTFGNIFLRKKRLAARILGVQKSLDSVSNPFFLDLEKSLINDYNGILKMEEDFWALKARINYTLDGDRNTKFFHASVLSHRRRNKIFALKNSNNSWLYEEGQIKEVIEIRSVLRTFKPWKAPGPDGLHPAFFQRCWNLINTSVFLCVRDAFVTGKIQPEINQTLLCLIPKSDHPETITQFRPIGLCNTIYKVITKTLVARLRPFLNDIISPLQSSFIPGRKGTDNVIIVQECVHQFKSKKGKSGNMLIKLDLEKAFDRLEWGFIRQVLTFFNFPPLWIILIMSCVSTSSIAILFNGGLTDSFTPTRGIRQGNPLSPCLSILCLEYLSITINKACDENLWAPIKLSRGGPQLSHLFFVDDLILFGKATKSNCECIKNILQDFCTQSGQKVSFLKSKVLFSTNLNTEIQDHLALTLQIPKTTNLGKYLGCPIFHNRPNRATYHFLVEKIQSKLSGWKSKLLSNAGRTTLIKAVNAAIPSYIMQCNYLLISTCKALDKINRDFLWGSNTVIRKIHAISWDTVTKPKHFGGLGIRQSNLVNRVAMAKLGWRLQRDKDALWVKVLNAKYKNPNLRPTRASPTWRGIHKGHNIIEKGTKTLLRNGLTTSFWLHNWVGIGLLRNVISGPLTRDEVSLKISDCDDQAIWNFSVNGDFQSKSAYLLSKDFIISPPLSNWDWVWRIHASPRITHFLWLCLHQRIITKSLLFCRNITSDDTCPLCSLAPETTCHILRDCPSSQDHWNSIGIPPLLKDSFNLAFTDWVRTNCQSAVLHSTNVAWSIIFPITCWSLWKARNSHCFSPNNPTPFNPSLITSLALEWQHTSTLFQPTRTKSTHFISWHPPYLCNYKLNTDGSAKGCPGPVSGGGIIRDKWGQWVTGFCRNIGTASSLEAEFWAL